MSNPFHDIADEYDKLTDRLRSAGDEWATGQLSVGAQPAEEPPADTPSKPSSSTSKSSS